MEFTENLDYLLKINGMKRTDLSRSIDIPISTINSWYRRSSDNIGLSSLTKIADFFDCSLDLLVYGKGIEDYKPIRKVIYGTVKTSDDLSKEDIKKLKKLASLLDYVVKIDNNKADKKEFVVEHEELDDAMLKRVDKYSEPVKRK